MSLVAITRLQCLRVSVLCGDRRTVSGFLKCLRIGIPDYKFYSFPLDCCVVCISESLLKA